MTQRAEERDRLLVAIEAACSADARVAAAWLIGSLGGGAGDEWSDLDVWVVPYAGREAGLLSDLVRAVGEPRLQIVAPQNAPTGGEFLTTAYDAPSGPLLVDWYLQPFAYAARPQSQRTLVLRADLPELAPPTPPRMRHAATDHCPDAFWALALVQAKELARRAQVLDFEVQLAELAGIAPPPPNGKPLKRLRALLALAPPHHIRPAVEQHLDFVEKSLAGRPLP